MELATQLRKRPAFQTSEFFIMVIGKNEVNLFPGIPTRLSTMFLDNGLSSGKYGSGNPIGGTTDVIQT